MMVVLTFFDRGTGSSIYCRDFARVSCAVNYQAHPGDRRLRCVEFTTTRENRKGARLKPSQRDTLRGRLISS